MENFDFNIGADPEFTIKIQNKEQSAKQVLTHIFKDYPNNKTKLGYKIGTNGIIGWDGIVSTGEIRPTQDKNPRKVVKNIKKLLEQITKKTKLIELSSLSNKTAIGGHIHIELTKNLKNTSKSSLINIHKKMSTFYFPLMLNENKINIETRTKQKRGKITDYKIKKFGKNKTYEFRAPNAEWLTTKKLAQATLCYFAVIFHELTENKENFNNTNKQFKTGFVNIETILLKKIKNKIKTFEKYKEFKEEINFILSPNKVKKEKESVNYNILKGWNLINKKLINK